MSPPGKLKPEQEIKRQLLCEISTTVDQAYQLAQSFTSMIRERKASTLDSWLDEATKMVRLRLRFIGLSCSNGKCMAERISIYYVDGFSIPTNPPVLFTKSAGEPRMFTTDSRGVFTRDGRPVWHLTALTFLLALIVNGFMAREQLTPFQRVSDFLRLLRSRIPSTSL